MAPKKKAKLSDAADDNLYGDINRKLNDKLEDAQDEIDEINDEVCDKVLEIEKEYNEKRKPLYEKRNEIIIKEVPDFWLRAFLRHPVLHELLNNEDQRIFKYLSTLWVEDFDDVKSGYSISFNFNSNPYFEATKITKTYTFPEHGITKVTVTPIKWKEGKSMPRGDLKQMWKRRILTYDSFFEWFYDIGERSDHEDWDHINEDGDNHPDNDLHNEIAELIKFDLWPNALTYYNKGVPYWDGEDSDDEDVPFWEDEDSDNEDDFEDEDEEEDEDESEDDSC